MKDTDNQHVSSAEGVAYKLLQDLLTIQKAHSNFDNMSYRDKQQHILDLFIQCLKATKDQVPYVPELPHRVA